MTWSEVWHEGLDEASRMYFGDGNVDGMVARLRVRSTNNKPRPGFSKFLGLGMMGDVVSHLLPGEK